MFRGTLRNRAGATPCTSYGRSGCWTPRPRRRRPDLRAPTAPDCSARAGRGPARRPRDGMGPAATTACRCTTCAGSACATTARWRHDDARPLDVLAASCSRSWPIAPGERDMVVLKHEFRPCFPTATRGDHLDPRRLRHARRRFGHGAHGVAAGGDRRPADPGRADPAARRRAAVTPKFYGPVLAELAELGIVCEERPRRWKPDPGGIPPWLQRPRPRRRPRNRRKLPARSSRNSGPGPGAA